MSMKAFVDRKFYHCFNLGHGDAGIHDYEITFEEAYKIIEKESGIEAAKRWVNHEDGYSEFRSDYYMIDEYSFDESSWTNLNKLSF